VISRSAPWLIAVFAAVSCVATIILALRRDADVNDRLQREIEARELEAQGLVVAAQKEQKDLRTQVASLEANNVDLMEALSRARRASPGSRDVSAVQASTGPVGASGDARPTVVSDDPKCLLAEGDMAEIRVDQVEIETKAGNRVIVGAAECRRVEPKPETRLAGGPFEASLTTAMVIGKPKQKPPGWGVGPAVMVSSSDGLAYGVAVSAPPLNVFGVDFEVGLAGAVGKSSMQGFAIMLVRP